MCELVPKPWTRVEADYADGCATLIATERSYRLHGLFPESILSQGIEMLAGPIRLSGIANGMPITWQDDAGCFLLEPSPDHAVVNGYAQSECLIVNTTFDMAYDGAAHWDIKVMPRGLTVPQVFGLEKSTIPGYCLTCLHLDVPLSKEACSLYIAWPAKGIVSLKTGEILCENGGIQEGGMVMPFTPTLWLGNERVGLNFVCESDEYWQPESTDRAIEVLDKGDHWLLRLRLLDSLPECWGEKPNQASPALNYRLGLIATPVKPWDNSYLKYNVLHIDCFIKLKNDYYEFFTSPMSEADPELAIDRIARLGVNMLVLHEKWTKIQNYWEFATTTKSEILMLVKLCHARGIKVLPYFGYEISSHIPYFPEIRDQMTYMREENSPYSGWYRVPYQRAMKVCYQSEWRDALIEGIARTMDVFDFDGVYLDSTTHPVACCNEAHGCGWRDARANLHGTYPIWATREVMQGIYSQVHARGGIVNLHPSGVTLPIATGFCDMLWDGEHIQTAIREKGIASFSLPYFRSEYMGRNQGIPVQFIVYEFAGKWSFEMSLSLALIHGVYPRPNDIGKPLEVMSRIWMIIGLYGVAEADFHGYWENGDQVAVSREEAKVSFYERTDPDNAKRLLVFCANPTPQDIGAVRVTFTPQVLGCGAIERVSDLDKGGTVTSRNNGIDTELGAFGLRIFQVTLR